MKLPGRILYNIAMIDDDYHYAQIFGKNLDYMWILSRFKTIPNEVKQNTWTMQSVRGYATDQLLWTIQE